MAPTQRDNPPDRVTQARIDRARAQGFTDIFWCPRVHEIFWQGDWVGRPPVVGDDRLKAIAESGNVPQVGNPNPPVPLPYLSSEHAAALCSVENQTAIAA